MTNRCLVNTLLGLVPSSVRVRDARTRGVGRGDLNLRKQLLVGIVVCGVGLSAAPSLQAQITTATLYGTVTDPSGAALAGAQVTATNTGTNLLRTAQANDVGEYRIEFLPVGSYAIEVSGRGFKKFVQRGIVLEIGQSARVDATLQVGSVNEEVSVTAAAPLVNTGSPELARTVENAEITNLPIVNRNVYTLLTLTAGVQRSENSIVLGFPEQRTLINGGVDGGAGSVNYYLDGGANITGLRNTGNILPNPDAVQEFRVETNNYNAQYGRFSSGVITVITKSGTNNFHGSLFEFARNTSLNANVWGNASDKPPLHRNQFGGTLGGPIRKDKTFFFFSYQGLRQITPNFESSAIVPTAAERTGQFSSAIKNPFVMGTPAFAGNQIPTAMLDPTARYIINNFIPMPNTLTVDPITGVSKLNQWQGFAAPSPFNSDDFLVKVDHTLTSKQRLTGSYFESSGTNTIATGAPAPGASAMVVPWSTQQFNWRQQNATLSDTWSIRASMINQAWLTFTRNFGGRLNLPQIPLGAAGLTTPQSLGSNFTIQGTPSLPQITVTNFFTLSQAIAGPRAGTNYYGGRDVLSINHGRHALSVGGELSRDNDVQDTLLNNYGTFTFGSGNTSSALADFELGLPSTVTQDAPVTPYTNSWNFALFAQDNFRVIPRLTLNLGVRWDVQTPPTDPLNRESTFVPGVQSTVKPQAPLGELFPGDPGITRGIVPVRWHHISPRLGLAWDPFGDGKTSIRAAAGVFYGSVSGNEWNATSNFEPFAIRLNPFPNIVTATATKPIGPGNSGATLTNPYNNFPGGNPFPYTGGFVAGGSIFGVSPNFQWPYTYQFNLSVQRQITTNFSMSVAYVGSLSHNLPLAVDLNYPLLISAGSGATCSGALGQPLTSNVICRRPIDNPNLGRAPSQFGQVFAVNSSQGAWYHGLQITASKRMSKHFLLNGFYTYSKTLQSAELQNNTTNPTGAGQVPQDYRNLGLEKSRTDDDIRHMFSLSGTWQLNYYNGTNSALRGVLNGWSISPIITLRSGLPVTVVSGRDNNLDGSSANDRPNVVPGTHLTLNPHRSRAAATQQWFNTAAFFMNGTGQDGTASRNILDAPGFKNVELAIFRDFKVRERYTLQARAEALNAFNLVSLNPPNASGPPLIPGGAPVSATFGQINTANPMRQIQLGLRLTF